MNSAPPAGLFTGPYRGLEPFDEASAAFFFGRDRETRLIVASLYASRLTLLYGASGVGKSSVLRAGVLPQLRQRPDILPLVFPRFARTSSGNTFTERGWQDDPVAGIKESLVLAMSELAGEDEELRRKWNDELLHDEMKPLPEFLSLCSDLSERRLMIILDQFEEYSLYHPEDDAFARQLPEVLTSSNDQVSIMLSMREDTLSKLDRFEDSIPTLWDSYRRIDHLDSASAEEAIRLPLEEHNRRFGDSEPSVQIEDNLVQAVLEQVQTENVEFRGTGSGVASTSVAARGRIETPYLQLVMSRLWEREQEMKSNVLRLATLDGEGGASRIVMTHLDRVMEQFDETARDIAAKVFDRLVTPSGTKVTHSVKDLARYDQLAEQQLADILRRLEDGSQRILRRVARPMPLIQEEEACYEIFHDRLGAAILDWRNRHLEKRASELSRRQEFDRIRILEEQRKRKRKEVSAKLDKLTPEQQGAWAKVLHFLVGTGGTRATLSAEEIIQHSGVTRHLVVQLLDELQLSDLIVRKRVTITDRDAVVFELVDDASAAAVLDWHASYVNSLIGKPDVQLSLSNIESSDSSYRNRGLEPDVEVFLRYERTAFFLGGGVSASSRHDRSLWHTVPGPGTPLGYELKELLAHECGFPMSELHSSSLADVASFYEQRFLRISLDIMLEKTFSEAGGMPSKTHRLIAQLASQVPQMVLTTNYDTLMEHAFEEEGLAYDTLVFPHPDFPEENSLLEKMSSGPLDKSLIVRLYGPARDRYVFTVRDHLRWQAKFGTDFPKSLRRELLTRDLFFLGMSAHDWQQKGLIDVILPEQHRSHRERSILRAIERSPSQSSLLTWQSYGVEVMVDDLNVWAARTGEALGLHIG